MIDWKIVARYSVIGVGTVCLTWLIASGRIIVPDDVSREVLTLMLGLAAGWLGLRRPGDIAP
jgi:hypothetical protein